MLNFSKLCQKCIFLHCSKILRKISCKNVQYFTLAHAHKPKFGFFFFFFLPNSSDFFPRCVPFRFSLLSCSLYLLHRTSFLLTWKVSIFSNEIDYEQPLFFRSPSSVKQKKKKKSARKLGTRRAEAKREKMRDYPLSHSF